MENTNNKTTKTATCKMCKPYREELGVGFIRNANQVVPCFDCNPNPIKHGFARASEGFESLNKRLAEIAAS